MIASLVLLQAALSIAVAGPATSPEFLPLHVAAAEGYFAEEDVAVSLETKRSDSLASQALGRGQVDLAATSLDAALLVGQTGGAPPRVVFGLTGLPPVVLVVTASEKDRIRSPADLRGSLIGIASPGTPGELVLFTLLARAGVGVHQVTIQSFGDRPLVGAVESGRVAAAMLDDPWASRLIAEGKAVALADLRERGEAARWLGEPTVHAAIFARADSKLGAAELTPFCRALLRALARIREAGADQLAAKLPPAVVGPPDEFAARLAGARNSFLPDGRVTADMLAAGIAQIRLRTVLPDKLKIPRNLDKLLLSEPLDQALRRR